jgi:glycosyltransferase involved in cell wall biosynthesis
MPIHNKSEIISEIIKNLMSSLTVLYEIIFIDDASEDGSSSVIENIIKKVDLNSILIKSNTPLYETMCDNVGFLMSRGVYVMEVQSDLYISDIGFDARLIKYLEEYNFSSISGRGGHSWSNLLDPRERVYDAIFNSMDLRLLLVDRRTVGLMGEDLFERKNLNSTIRQEIYVVDTNIRGPWLTKKIYLQEYGLFDTENFFLGYDEHEFNLRMRKEGHIAGYAAVNIFSDKSDGSTRKVRSGKNAEIYNELISKKNGKKEILQTIKTIKSNICQKIKLG